MNVTQDEATMRALARMPAVELAVGWWVVKLMQLDQPIPVFTLEVFREKLRELLVAQMDAWLAAPEGKRDFFAAILEVDYEPQGLLLQALLFAGIRTNTIGFDTVELPRKTMMRVWPTVADVKEGYGALFLPLVRPQQDDVALVAQWRAAAASAERHLDYSKAVVKRMNYDRVVALRENAIASHGTEDAYQLGVRDALIALGIIDRNELPRKEVARG